MSEVVGFARQVDEWMKSGGREQIAASSARCRRVKQDRSGGTTYSVQAGHWRLQILRRHQLLSQIATRQDRVCVLNITGGESKDVTPVGHVYSGGNVVFGTSPGRSGQVLNNAWADPVYNSVREGLDAGHRFNCGVVHSPPSAARDGVAELIRVNPKLNKIFIVTEKLSVHDSREIRAMGQQNGIDIFGGNSLGGGCLERGPCIGGAWAATAWPRRSRRARSPFSPTPATSPPRSRRICGWRLGHDHGDLQRQGHLHPLRRPRSSPSLWPTTPAARPPCCTGAGRPL